MTLDDLLFDIHVLQYELQSYERKFGMLSEIFYEAYANGEEPPDDSWVQDWSAWAGNYELWLSYRQEYRDTIQKLRSGNRSIADAISRTASREPISVAA
jgi:hypothetical protein